MLKNNNVKTLLALSLFSSAFFVCGDNANATTRGLGKFTIGMNMLTTGGVKSSGNGTSTQRLLNSGKNNGPNYGTFGSTGGSTTSTTGSGNSTGKNPGGSGAPPFNFGLRSFRGI